MDILPDYLPVRWCETHPGDGKMAPLVGPSGDNCASNKLSKAAPSGHFFCACFSPWNSCLDLNTSSQWRRSASRRGTSSWGPPDLFVCHSIFIGPRTAFPLTALPHRLLCASALRLLRAQGSSIPATSLCFSHRTRGCSFYLLKGIQRSVISGDSWVQT